MKKIQEDNREWQSAGRYLVRLLQCAIHDQLPEKKSENFSWEQVWMLAKRNSVENTVSLVIRKMKDDIPEEVWKGWSGAFDQNLYRLVRFEMEREQILTEISKQGLAALPLKGILVADYYPNPGMRWMCDNDILYGYAESDEEDGFRLKGNDQAEQEYWQGQAQKKLREIMEKLGYTTENLKGTHDVYHKKPFFNFEMHRRLVPEDSSFAEYYANPWKKAKRIENKAFQYRFSDEDEYLFLIAHAYKHFDSSGCGIRTLVDEYMILQEKTKLDWSYIKRELEETGLKDFEEKLRLTALHAFGNETELTLDEWKLIFYMLGCGTYGTYANRVKRKLEKLEELDVENVKKTYFMDRFWIDEKKMKEFYPFFYHHRGIRFLLPVYRLGKGMFLHPGQLIREWKALNKYTSAKNRERLK